MTAPPSISSNNKLYRKRDLDPVFQPDYNSDASPHQSIISDQVVEDENILDLDRNYELMTAPPSSYSNKRIDLKSVSSYKSEKQFNRHIKKVNKVMSNRDGDRDKNGESELYKSQKTKLEVFCWCRQKSCIEIP